LVVGGYLVLVNAVAYGLEFSAAERLLILQHGPWPMSLAQDSSNRASGKPAAIRLGESLAELRQLPRSRAGFCRW
jgi:hypothetical protein